MRKKLYSILLLVWLLVLAACVPGGENYVSTQETGTESNEELTTPEDTAGTDSEQQDGHTSQFNLADIPESRQALTSQSMTICLSLLRQITLQKLLKPTPSWMNLEDVVLRMRTYAGN